MNTPYPPYQQTVGTPAAGFIRKTATPLVLGILSMVFSIIPIIGIVLAICGLVPAVRQKRNGCITMCILGLLFSMILVALGTWNYGEEQQRWYRFIHSNYYYNSYYY